MRMIELESQFNAKQAEKAQYDQRSTALQEELLILKGAYQECERLLDPQPNSDPLKIEAIADTSNIEDQEK